MLNMTQKLTFTGTSVIDDTTCISMFAQIDMQDPEKLRLTHSVVNSDVYRDNQDECDADIAEFDSAVLEIQKELEEQDSDVSEVSDEADE